MKKPFLILLLLCLPCFAQTSYRNTVSLAIGDPELLDFEYQYDFNKFYVAVKPGIITMLIYHSSIHDWNFYPAIRFGVDVFKFRHFSIGPQIEYAYFYTSWAEKNVLTSGGNYYSESKSDYSMFSFGPAIRYFWKRLELQLSAGFHFETTINYSKSTIDNKVENKVNAGDTKFLQMARFSAGILF